MNNDAFFYLKSENTIVKKVFILLMYAFILTWYQKDNYNRMSNRKLKKKIEE